MFLKTYRENLMSSVYELPGTRTGTRSGMDTVRLAAHMSRLSVTALATGFYGNVILGEHYGDLMSESADPDPEFVEYCKGVIDQVEDAD